MGIDAAAHLLARMDRYYQDQNASPDGVASQVLRQLADPRPVDESVTRQLHHYKGLGEQWQRWDGVVNVCKAVAARMMEI